MFCGRQSKPIQSPCEKELLPQNQCKPPRFWPPPKKKMGSQSMPKPMFCFHRSLGVVGVARFVGP